MPPKDAQVYAKSLRKVNKRVYFVGSFLDPVGMEQSFYQKVFYLSKKHLLEVELIMNIE